MPKNIYINARFLTQPISGVQRFSYEMSKRLSKEYRHRLILLVPRGMKIQKYYNYDFNIKKIGINRSHFWEQLDLFFYLKSKKNPLLINFSNSCPLLYKNQISTIHDLSIYESKKMYSTIYTTFYKFIFPIMIKRCHKILTVSNFTKSEIIKKFNIYDNNIIITNNAVSFKNISTISKNNDNYILYVGNDSKRKNLCSLIKAFNLIKNNNIYLKIVGSISKENYENIYGNKRIEVLSHVTTENLFYLYNNAKMLVFPSLYEGFGIPPLEAMYCSCPVIVSNIDVFKELYGTAALYIDPLDVSQLKESILRLLDDSTLRQKYINKGIIQAKKYSWEKSSYPLIKEIDSLCQ